MAGDVCLKASVKKIPLSPSFFSRQKKLTTILFLKLENYKNTKGYQSLLLQVSLISLCYVYMEIRLSLPSL